MRARLGSFSFLTLTRVTPAGLVWLRAEAVLASSTGLIALQYKPPPTSNRRCTRNPALANKSNSLFDFVVFALQDFSHSPCSRPE